MFLFMWLALAELGVLCEFEWSLSKEIEFCLLLAPLDDDEFSFVPIEYCV